MATKPAAKPTATSKPVAAKTPASSKTVKPGTAKPATAASTAKPVAKPVAKVAAKPATVAPKKATPAAQKPVAKVVGKPAVNSSKPVTADKSKTPKVKMERDSFTMPKDEYAQIAALKKRLEAAGKAVKKSELLRAGLKLLSGLDDTKLKAALATVPTIKTGRPKK
ncbi:hypothetical protein [Methylophilus sp. Leaf408]|uniref:hypothetical protein n=1 Tax=Methylophilus sp. Leaf408 TaxID=2876561 RepID=UPI001E3C8F82|nr:hypothetical protein [Methylophilus sp. Leaf408]